MSYRYKTKAQLIDELKALTRRILQIEEFRTTHLQYDEVGVLIKNALDSSSSNLESLGRLAGGIAHDFNNILPGIMGNISLAQVYLDNNDKLHQILADAEKFCVKAKSLTEKFITFSRGGQPLKKITSISELLRASCNLSVSGSNVRCTFRIQNGFWPVKVDETQMHQVFSNVVINAAEAMPNGGIVNIMAENFSIDKENSEKNLRMPNKKFVRITIKDNGKGIPKKYLSKIFDPYFSTQQ